MFSSDFNDLDQVTLMGRLDAAQAAYSHSNDIFRYSGFDKLFDISLLQK